MNKQQEMVREFHEAFGHPVSDTPTNIPEATASLRHVLMLEELQEYRDAAEAGDLVEVADALADLMYVALGTAVAHGIDLEPVFEAVHSSNMQKRQPDGSVRYRADGKVSKPADWTPPNVGEVLKGQGWNE